MGMGQASLAIAAIISILSLMAWDSGLQDRAAKYTVGLMLVVPLSTAFYFPFVYAILWAFGYPEGEG